MDSQGASCVLNASETSSPELALRVLGEGWSARSNELELPLAPLELRKVGFALESLGEAPEGEFELVLEGPLGELARSRHAFVLREALEARRLTFLSELDRSVQEYSVRPPSADSGDGNGIGPGPIWGPAP